VNPDDLPPFLRKGSPDQPPRPPVNGHVAPPGTASRYATKALTDELDTLARTPQGSRNHQLNVAAFNLSQLVAAGHLDHDTTWAQLTHTAHAIGLTTSETRNTLTSAFRAGLKLPRDVADYGVDEAPPVTVLGVVDETSEEDVSAAIRARFPAIDWAELWEDDTEDEWIVAPILPARRFVALFSPPKVGKSLLLLELAVAIARGETVLGHTPDRPRRVLYLDFENDPRGDVRTRLQAMGRKPDELVDLVYLSYPSLHHLDSFAGACELLAICEEYGVEVVVIDTISRAVSGEENDNDTWLGLYRNTGVALKRAGIAAIRLDHTGKDHTKGMRGGSAKYGDVDAVWSMTRLSETTYRLECTANRLPIGEKVLIIERAQGPLRHTVALRRTGDVVQDEVDAHVAELDRLQVPETWGRERCEAALKKAGFTVSHRRLRDAIQQRQQRAGVIPMPEEDE